MSKKIYLVKTRLSSVKHGRDYLPGETIDLSHATDEQIADLLEQGAIELPAAKPAKADGEEK